MIVIDTVEAYVRAGNTLYAYCPSAQCTRRDEWAQIDLEALVRRGYGSTRIVRLRPLCRYCGTSGRLQVRRPGVDWTPIASTWGGISRR